MLGLTACASIPQPQQLNLQAEDPFTRSCAELFSSLDVLVRDAGVTDLGARRIEGFPYLRTNRFLGSFRDELDDNPTLRGAWLQQMRQLDAEGRRFELSNTPEDFSNASRFSDRAEVREKIERCGEHLSAVDLQYPA